MIDPRSRSLEWIEQAKQHIPGVSDTPLVEKAIRALSLLESLVRSGCPFIFKGGTALMLHLDTSRRLSIDVDIVLNPEFDFLQGSEPSRVYREAFSSYDISRPRLFRYAQRRGCLDKIQQLIDRTTSTNHD